MGVGVQVIAQAVLVVAAALGAVHGQVGSMDQLVHGGRMIGEQGNAQTGTNTVVAPLQGDHRRETGKQFLADLVGLVSYPAAAR